MKNIAIIKEISSLVLQGLGFSPKSTTVHGVKSAIGLVALFSDLSKSKNLKSFLDGLKLSGKSFSSADLDFLLDKFRLGGQNARLAENILKNLSVEDLINNFGILSSYINNRDVNLKYLATDLAVKALENLDIEKLVAYSGFLERASRLQNTELKRRIAKLLRLIAEYYEDNNSDKSDYVDFEEIVNNPTDYSDKQLESALILRLKNLEKVNPELLHHEALFLETCLKEENKEISSLARKILLKMGVSRSELKKLS